jgi:hypothetical protein
MVTCRDVLLDLWGWGRKIQRRKLFQILIPNIGSNKTYMEYCGGHQYIYGLKRLKGKFVGTFSGCPANHPIDNNSGALILKELRHE